MPGNSVFVKTFLGFWLVTVAVLGSWLLAGRYLDTLLPDENHSRRDSGPPRFVVRLLYDLQNQPGEALAESIAAVQDAHKIRVYLIKADGDDALGRSVPAPVTEIARRLDSGGRRAVHRVGGRRLLANQLYRDDLGPVRSVLVFKPNRSRLMSALGSNLWLRISIAVLVSGLLCYLLSRLLTARLARLQQAVHNLADGQFATQLAVREQGGDETDVLARGFNCMALQLQQRIDAQRRLLADVSHEIRSPLARLQVALALAQRNPAAAAPQLARIERETARLDELIAELLDSQREAVVLDEYIDLAALLRDLCSDAAFEGRSSSRAVRFTSACEQVLVKGSSAALRKAFDNILRNALRHTPPHSGVQVELTENNKQLRVTVRDRGPGIPEVDLARIFDDFYRVDTARTRDTGGYGLGLAIARRAILQHGGIISAANTGNGLLMTATLPLFTG